MIVEFCNVGEGGAWQFKTYLEKGESVVVAPEERFYLSVASDLKFQLQLSESKPTDVTSHALSDTKTELAEYLETEECATTRRSFSTHSVLVSVVQMCCNTSDYRFRSLHISDEMHATG